jgi:hypothetical protein
MLFELGKGTSVSSSRIFVLKDIDIVFSIIIAKINVF